MADELLTVAELAAALRISLPRAYALIDEAGIPHLRLSERRIRIPRHALNEWMEKQTVRNEKSAAVAA